MTRIGDATSRAFRRWPVSTGFVSAAMVIVVGAVVANVVIGASGREAIDAGATTSTTATAITAPVEAAAVRTADDTNPSTAPAEDRRMTAGAADQGAPAAGGDPGLPSAAAVGAPALPRPAVAPAAAAPTLPTAGPNAASPGDDGTETAASVPASSPSTTAGRPDLPSQRADASTSTSAIIPQPPNTRPAGRTPITPLRNPTTTAPSITSRPLPPSPSTSAPAPPAPITAAPSAPVPDASGAPSGYAWHGWGDVASHARPAGPNVHVIESGSVGGDAHGAITRALAEHGEVRLVGTFDLDRAIELRSNQVLRGSGAGRTVLRFRGAGSGVHADLGGISGRSVGVRSASFGATQLTLDAADSSIAVGDLLVLSAFGNEPLTLRVTARPSSAVLTLSGPLPRAVADSEALTVLSKEPVRNVGIADMTIEAAGSVDYLVRFKGVVNGWVDNVEMRNPRRAHVMVTYSAGCEVRRSFFDDASEHGDGGRGYGVNLANGTTGCLIEDNEFRHLRHAMLVNDGAAGNAFVFNHAWDGHHTNFPYGGPPDIILHGPAHANLFEGNVIERIYIGDNPTGANNVFLRNCLTTGPLSYQYGRGTQLIVANAMYGSDEVLQTLRMEDRWPDHEPFGNGRSSLPFVNPGDGVFNGRGVVRIGSSTAASALPAPVELNNVWRGQPDGPQGDASRFTTRFSGRQSILATGARADWTSECAVAAVTRAARR
ncbi:MAG: hypothetical protein AAF467_12440 [Actinomycetota bacterium]